MVVLVLKKEDISSLKTHGDLNGALMAMLTSQEAKMGRVFVVFKFHPAILISE
jgi:hypothetical protein